MDMERMVRAAGRAVATRWPGLVDMYVWTRTARLHARGLRQPLPFDWPFVITPVVAAIERHYDHTRRYVRGT